MSLEKAIIIDNTTYTNLKQYKKQFDIWDSYSYFYNRKCPLCLINYKGIINYQSGKKFSSEIKSYWAVFYFFYAIIDDEKEKHSFWIPKQSNFAEQQQYCSKDNCAIIHPRNFLDIKHFVNELLRKDLAEKHNVSITEKQLTKPFKSLLKILENKGY